MLQRIVVDPAHIHPPTVSLTSHQYHYLSRVLRLKPGDHFIVMNGQGCSWLAILQDSPTSEGFQAQLIEAIATQTELPVSVTLVIALPKGNALDDVVRQATELGVTCFAPVISDRTLLNPSPQKLERWRRIAQEAAEQSERQQVPTILEPILFTEHLQKVIQFSPSNPHYFCVTRYHAPLFLPRLLTSNSFPSALSVAIGPEGGWTEPEIAAAIAAGYQPVSLGARILRTVTAPIVALSLITAVYEGGMVNQGIGNEK
ncbi:RNA methyltransferase, RsmE family [Leptolyngbyaceae cyanobacterium JSC-12]|nr:RNA methyltransferase, RsmE family [Leptolyngbyaceae cyanobacterium JSC-12]